MHDEQKSLNKAKTYKAINIDNIPNEIEMKARFDLLRSSDTKGHTVK